MIFNLSDTIAAISSAPGNARRGIVRLSGTLATEVVATCWRESDNKATAINFTELPAWNLINGRFIISEQISVPAEVAIFRPPASYTSENMVELHLPGSQKLLNMVLEKLVSFESVRLAEPGEFTGRAFLNGRIDLTEAEAVAEVIHASGDAQLHAAENLMAGMLHNRCRVYSDAIADLLALVEAGIDFSDQEDIEFIDTDKLITGIDQIVVDIAHLLHDSQSWQDLHNMPKVILVGPPNAGKSSLVNRLTGLDRSIVCSIAGTTRDILSAPVKLELGECLLVDTPGLGAVDDALGQKSQKRVTDALSDSDLIVILWDPSQTSELGEIVDNLSKNYSGKLISIANKKDLFIGNDLPFSGIESLRTDLFISAETGENVNVLKDLISDCLHFGANSNRSESIALTNRHATALADTSGTLKKLSSNLKDGLNQAEIIALELRDALDYIGSISGEIATDDVLGRIFSKFCIGK